MTDVGLTIGERGPLHADAREDCRADRQLQNLCGEFEGILLSILLKESLTGHALADDEDDGGRMLMEHAVENAARHMGREGGLGIGEMLLASIRGPGDAGGGKDAR